MSSFVLSLGALATICLGVAVLLWQYANQRSKRDSAISFVQSQIAQRTDQNHAMPQPIDGGPRIWTSRSSSWNELLLRAGINPTLRFHFLLVAVPFALTVAAMLFSGPVGGAAVLVMSVTAIFLGLWIKAERLQRATIRQIPDFIDAVVRLMTVGNSMGSAFHGAALTIDQPLRKVMDKAASLHRSGQELDVALRHVSRQYGLHELYLVAAVIGVAMRFGGSSDQVLERMAAFIRDLDQARHELRALSAEVRSSAWVLALLPLGIAGFILIFNNSLLTAMWHDPAGWKLLSGAGVLQVVGSYWLYRMAKLT